MPKINDLPQVDNLSQSACVPVTQDGVTYKANIGMLGGITKKKTLDLLNDEEGVYIVNEIINGVFVWFSSSNALVFLQDASLPLETRKKAFIIGGSSNPTEIKVINSI